MAAVPPSVSDRNANALLDQVLEEEEQNASSSVIASGNAMRRLRLAEAMHETGIISASELRTQAAFCREMLGEMKVDMLNQMRNDIFAKVEERKDEIAQQAQIIGNSNGTSNDILQEVRTDMSRINSDMEKIRDEVSSFMQQMIQNASSPSEEAEEEEEHEGEGPQPTRRGRRGRVVMAALEENPINDAGRQGGEDAGGAVSTAAFGCDKHDEVEKESATTVPPSSSTGNVSGRSEGRRDEVDQGASNSNATATAASAADENDERDKEPETLSPKKKKSRKGEKGSDGDNINIKSEEEEGKQCDTKKNNDGNGTEAQVASAEEKSQKGDSVHSLPISSAAGSESVRLQDRAPPQRPQDPRDNYNGPWLTDAEQQEMQNIYPHLPLTVKDRFREVGFAKWDKWRPCLELGPFDVGGGVRDDWMRMYTRGLLGRGNWARLVYWYGVPKERAGEAFSMMTLNDVVSYEEGLERGYDKIPTKIQKKLDKKKKLTRAEQDHMTGLEQIRCDSYLPKQLRMNWMTEDVPAEPSPAPKPPPAKKRGSASSM